MKYSVGPRPERPAQRPEARASEAAGNHPTLALVDDHAYKEHGYNPYDTIAHARATRGHDVWRHKPKRA